MMALRVALTFDAEHPDRPTEFGAAERLLDALARAEVVTTFFMQGRWAEAYPTTAVAITTAGHLVGNHSHYHARMPLLTDAGLAEDITEAGRVIAEITGVDPRPWFRLPFGDGAGDPRIQAAIAAAGYQQVGWHVDPEDWAADRNDPMTIERGLLGGVEAQGDGTVILLHSWPRGTPDALVRAIPRLRDQGAVFVRIDELDEVPATPSWV
jgi:peptidoglycan/xylan/chitin deacetylase (PgdA/CDA1 family)